MQKCPNHCTSDMPVHVQVTDSDKMQSSVIIINTFASWFSSLELMVDCFMDLSTLKSRGLAFLHSSYKQQNHYG